MTKVGRNEPCPCGSGKKYKKCHGDLARSDRITAAIAAMPRMIARHEAAEHQRIEQQGLGKPIVAVKMDNGHQFVAVKNRLLYSNKWKTFHDFLGDYLKMLSVLNGATLSCANRSINGTPYWFGMTKSASINV